MKKEYVFAEIEVFKLTFGDIITTSGEGSDDPTIDPNRPFEGGYDKDGWT